MCNSLFNFFSMSHSKNRCYRSLVADTCIPHLRSTRNEPASTSVPAAKISSNTPERIKFISEPLSVRPMRFTDPTILDCIRVLFSRGGRYTTDTFSVPSSSYVRPASVVLRFIHLISGTFDKFLESFRHISLFRLSNKQIGPSRHF